MNTSNTRRPLFNRRLTYKMEEIKNPILKEIDELLYNHPVSKEKVEQARNLFGQLKSWELTDVEGVHCVKLVNYLGILLRLHKLSKT